MEFSPSLALTFADESLQLIESTRAIGLMVSVDAKSFALARFPPYMRLENQVSSAPSIL